MMHLKYRKTCRVCGSDTLKPVISLGEQYLQGSFIKDGKEMPVLRRIPLTLTRCNPEEDENACGLLQLEHSVPTEILYASYWYRSGTNRTMTQHLQHIASNAASIVGTKNARVLDIGCNDGTLLNAYPDEYVKYGVDPSDVAKQLEDKYTIVNDVFPSIKLDAILKGDCFDIITSIAMFYDLEDPVYFVREIKRHLSDKGLWVFEMSYMPTMLEKNSFDTLCHEHLEYYSLSVLEFILTRTDMKLVKIEFNDINGGSVQCYATHADNSAFDNITDQLFISNVRQREFELCLDTDKPYEEFQRNVKKVRDDLSNLIQKLHKEGKKIHIYGASTKGNTILQWCGIDNKYIECASDRNPDKDGAMTLGTNIPIVSEEKSRSMNPDYYLVLPWHFKNEFIERESEMLDRGVGLIFPLPELEIVHNQ